MLKDVEETTAWMRDTVQAWNDWPLDRLSVDAGGLLEKVNEDKLARDVDDLSSIFEDLADGGDFALPCDDLETGCEVASGWIDGLDNSDGLDADVLNINELSAEFDVLVAEQDAEIEKTVASESSDADESMTESASEYDDDEDMEDVDDEEEVPSKPCSILVPSKIVPAAPVWVMSAPLDPRSCIRTAVFKNVDSRIPRISIPRMDLALADQTSSVAKHPLAALQTARLPTQTQDKQVKKCQVPEYKHNPSTCWICKSDKTPEKKRALHRFLEKRSRRNWKRGPRYSGRSHVAASRTGFLSSDKKKKLQAFKKTTNAQEATAKSYLEKFSWDLMRAVDEFYASGGEFSVQSVPEVSMDAVNEWFDQYADPDEEDDVIGEDGILKFCEDIGVDPQDIVVLVIAWKMEAAYMCAFTRKEWCKGMEAMGCDSISKLKAEILNLRAAIAVERDFKIFYSFCFGFSKEPGQKSLGIDIAIAMWDLLLSPRYSVLTAKWLEFLQEKKPCKGITRDTWDLLLDFFSKVVDSYDNYDENEAWPVLIDDYMAWIDPRTMAEEDTAIQTFATMDDLPDKAFFPQEYIRNYQRQINELIRRMEHLVQEVENFETESEACMKWNGSDLAALERDTVWHNLSALEDCGAVLDSIMELFKQKIRESIGMVATNPAQFLRERTESNSSMPQSQDDSSEEDDEMDDEFHDVEPVKGRKQAHALNDDVSARVLQAMGGNKDEFELFKKHALDFGTGNEPANTFYSYLSDQMTVEEISSIILDFARLLPQATLRIPLLKAHYTHINSLHHQADMQEQHRNKSWSSSQRPRESSLASDMGKDDVDSDDDHIDEFPSTLRLATVNQLMFIIHGIGVHTDFRDGDIDVAKVEEQTATDNFIFRDMYRTMLETMFRDIPVALELQSIEWHDDLHVPTGVDTVFDLICPEGSQGIREFNKETLMDVLYYLSPRYGQLIVDSVTEQLNQKYRIFMEEHPGWDGKVSIFAHSLGSVITYDILTHKRGEVSPNGVRFPGLDFEVDIFFAAGSPVPVMILSRGDLNIKDGNFSVGIKMPNCRRYYNIFHPIDPVAYRVEPLIKQDMHDKEPVQLIQAHTVKNLPFPKIQEMYEKLTGPIHGFSYRIDHVMRRRKREQGMMEIAFAAASHSSYWTSEDVVMFTIMQMCQPVVAKLQRYLSARQPIPKLMRNIAELTPSTRVYVSGNVYIRERCTGVSKERVVLMDKDRLHIIPRVLEVACRRKWRIKLTPSTRAVYGDDSFMMKIIPDDGLMQPQSAGASFSPARPSRSESSSGVYIFKAASTPVRNEWMNMINQTVLSNGGGHPNAPPSKKAHRMEVCHMVELPSGLCLDYFGAIKMGFLQEKSPKGWYEGWNNRWLVLQEDHLSCYENSPQLEFSAQFKLRKTRIYCYDVGYLFRIVSRSGTSLEMRAKDQDAFNNWLNAFSHVRTVQVIRHHELLENSPSAVLLMSNSDKTLSASKIGSEQWLKTKIETYRLETDEAGVQFATFVIHVSSSSFGKSIAQRRYSEFNTIHRKLWKMFPHEQVPNLPGTRMWNKFEPGYLKDKAASLHIYLSEVCKRFANTRAQPLLMEFLSLEPQKD